MTESFGVLKTVYEDDFVMCNVDNDDDVDHMIYEIENDIVMLMAQDNLAREVDIVQTMVILLFAVENRIVDEVMRLQSEAYLTRKIQTYTSSNSHGNHEDVCTKLGVVC